MTGQVLVGSAARLVVTDAVLRGSSGGRVASADDRAGFAPGLGDTCAVLGGCDEDGSGSAEVRFFPSPGRIFAALSMGGAASWATLRCVARGQAALAPELLAALAPAAAAAFVAGYVPMGTKRDRFREEADAARRSRDASGQPASPVGAPRERIGRSARQAAQPSSEASPARIRRDLEIRGRLAVSVRNLLRREARTVELSGA